MDPAALKRLSVELNAKKVEIAAAVKEANEWVRRYNELQQRLNEIPDDSARSEAKGRLEEGELEKVGAILDELLKKEETIVDRAADNHYNRALVLELQFLPSQALPHLETAYRRRPNRLEYAMEYGHVLLTQNDFHKAETVLNATLTTPRGAKTTPGVYRRYVVDALQGLGVVYSRTNRPNEAESVYREALNALGQLAASEPGHYDRDIAQTVNGLATLYDGQHRLAEAEELYAQALDIQRVLAQTDLSSILDVTDALSNLGRIYLATQRLPRAEANYVGVVGILRELVNRYPAAFAAYLARGLTRLATLYRDTNRSTEAETSYHEALEILRPLAEGDPALYRPDLGATLIELATLNDATQEKAKACQLVKEAVELVSDPELKKRVDSRFASCQRQ